MTCPNPKKFVAAFVFLGLGASPAIAQTAASQPADTPHHDFVQTASVTKPAEACLKDLRALNGEMRKEGYWLGSDSAYGYPLGGYGYGYGGAGLMGVDPVDHASGYMNVRPGYEIRVLMTSANILAQNGQQQPCEDVLAIIRPIYKTYAANLSDHGIRARDDPAWQRQQIDAAVPVAGQTAAFRSDELLDTDVRNASDESLGSVHDIVLDPQSGKIAYLVVARGGVFGIGEAFVPVPWHDFKTTKNVNLFVLDASNATMAAAPKVSRDAFSKRGAFDQQSQKVDAYWAAHLSNKTGG